MLFPRRKQHPDVEQNQQSLWVTSPVAIVRITAVSYLNTLPFIYGIEQAAPALAPHWKVLLSPAIPSECARTAADGTTDIALVPVAAIPQIPGFQPEDIITDYCIGAEGAVDTVVLLSGAPVETLRTIYLDTHSRTSVELVKVLARELWQISPQWKEAPDLTAGTPILNSGEGIVAIGDKVFGLKEHFTRCYDLSAEWRRLTGLPFVFAAWVACSPTGREFAPHLSRMLEYGTSHIAESITQTRHRSRDFEFGPSFEYLTQSIKFDLDAPKRTALKLFWEKVITPG